MAKQQFTLREAEAAQLHSAFLHEKDGPTRTRFQAVWLYGSGYKLAQVLSITGASRTSLFDWCRAYQGGGRDALLDKRRGGNSRKLTPEQITELGGRLTRYTPADLFGKEAARHWSVPLLKRAVEQWYGLRYRSETSYQSLFRRCGFSYQRPAKRYRSRREADVLEFEQRLEKKAGGSGAGGS